MSSLQIVEVKNKRTRELFWKTPFNIYKNDPNWYPPLYDDVMNLFEPTKNPLFAEGAKAKLWVAILDSSPVGRIAAFINPHYIKACGIKAGGFGFFECINDQQIASALLQRAESWLRSEGMDAIDGPINFGERNRWWGLLIENFSEPTYGMSYNPPYYKELLINAGYRQLYTQFTYSREVKAPLPEKLASALSTLSKDPNFSFEHFRWRQKDRFVRALVEIFNRAWSDRKDFRPLTYEHVMAEFKSYKPIIDPLLLWFAFYANKPIGFFIMFPDVTKAIKKMHGARLTLFNKLKLLWHIKRNKPDKILAILYGVVPEFRKKGVLYALVAKAYQTVPPLRPHYEILEMYWIGEFMKVMHKIATFYGATVSRKHVVMRKMLNPDMEFVNYVV